MSADPGDRGAAEVVTRARPGHADLAGVLNTISKDIRDVLERRRRGEPLRALLLAAWRSRFLRRSEST